MPKGILKKHPTSVRFFKKKTSYNASLSLEIKISNDQFSPQYAYELSDWITIITIDCAIKRKLMTFLDHVGRTTNSDGWSQSAALRCYPQINIYI